MLIFSSLTVVVVELWEERAETGQPRIERDPFLATDDWDTA